MSVEFMQYALTKKVYWQRRDESCREHMSVVYAICSDQKVYWHRMNYNVEMRVVDRLRKRIISTVSFFLQR